MTPRQKRLLEVVRPYLSEAYHQAMESPHQFGMTLAVRVPRLFVPGFGLQNMTPLMLEVVKLEAGPQFRIYEPGFWYRKGHTPPKWRKLKAAT